MDVFKGRKGTAVFIIAIVLAFLLFKRKKDPTPATAPITPATGVAISVPKTEQQQLIDSAAPENTWREITKLREDRGLMIENGLRAIPSIETARGLSLNLIAEAKATECRSGDFDFIKSMVQDLSAKTLLLTVEPMTNEKEVTFAKRLSVFDLGRSTTANVTVPFPDGKSRDYGVYICFDPRKTGNCSLHQTISPKNWNEALLKTKNFDRIVYFQMITVRGRTAYLIPSKNWDTASIESLKKVLKPMVESEKSLDRLGAIQRELSTSPAHISRQGLGLVIPYRHPNCH